jgi:hypothetical protein
MLKKIFLILSLTAALGIGIVAPAHARGGGHHGGHHGDGHHEAGHVHVHGNAGMHENRPANKHYVVGRRYDGHIWYGHRGHYWHGHWYGYGVGPCWIYIDGLWFWNPVACPL